MYLLGGVNVWMRVRIPCDTRRTSVINIPGTIYVPGTKHVFGVDDGFSYLVCTTYEC